jgi:D-alanyl-D-alanine carboxypeptidase/D-alanyl-D-alanine-endopeptidase (penicillin-binding protein 4)
MKLLILVMGLLPVAFTSVAQTVASRLQVAWAAFESDPQLRSAIASLYVIDGTTGSVVFDKNSSVGLAPASTQKIITAATAYEVLGKNFTYTTGFFLGGDLKDGRLSGSILVKPSGDPTLGSWRWKQTGTDDVIKRVAGAVGKAGVKSFTSFLVDVQGWDGEAIPGGWIWDDIGNYYGAGADVLNWRENQFDLYLKSGSRVGDAVTITGTHPRLYHYSLRSHLTAAAKGTGDNAYIYFSPNSATGHVRGTIPVVEERFTISGAMPSGREQFLATLRDSLQNRGIVIAQAESDDEVPAKMFYNNQPAAFHTETSPPLDSISYWFLKRSINLYGEALIKTIAGKRGKVATTSQGASEVQAFWSKKDVGIHPSELNIYDGSGLSPLNRTTTHAQAAILKYARSQPWFGGYYLGFPEYNGMKLKSGTITRVKSFSGYHTSKAGKEYIISFIVNNYNGSSSSLVQKMYTVLNCLK